MNTIDYFKKNGIRIPINGSKPQIIDNPRYVWMVEGGRVSLFLTTMTSDDLTGIRNFLFELGQGDLIFGMAPVDLSGKRVLLASGLDDSSLVGIEIEQFRVLLEGNTHEEVAASIRKWLDTLKRFLKVEDAAYSETALTSEEPLSIVEYAENTAVANEYNNQFIKYAVSIFENRSLAEQKRFQEKHRHNRRLLSNSISKLAAVNKKEKMVSLKEASGDFLLDACRLVGGSMNIEILAPPVESYEGQDNINLEDIARASRIRTREVALKGEWYSEDGGPILGYMEEDNRPVALIPLSPSRYMLHDPTLGIKKYVDRETAGKLKYFGFVFYRPFENKKLNIRDILYFGYLGCWKRDLFMLVLMGILGGILGTAVPLATGIVFSSVIPEGERGQLLQIAFFLGSSALAAMLFQLVRSIATLRIEGKMEGSIQASVWDRLLSLPVPFFKQFSAGELAMRAMGISRMRMILSGVTLNTILSSIFSVFNFALLFYYDPRLAGSAALLVAADIIVIGFLGYWQVHYEHRVLEISNKISGMMLQLIGGITKFRVAGAENRVFHRWSEEFGVQRKLTFKRETFGNWMASFNAFFPILSSMVIFYKMTSSNSPLAPGQFIAFNSAFAAFVLSMVSLSESIINANIVIPLYKGAKPILETLPEYDDKKINPRPLTGSIEVSHLSFRYKEDGPLILSDISFQINEGDYVALVGASGCGKSTLLRLLLGFEKPQTGEIYYNGQDLSKIDVRALRRQLGVVLQNGQLMIGNIFSNIVGANPYLTIDDAWEAAKMAGIDEDIRQMPMGMHTVISEGAGTISGGQKQRILIARAIVKKPKILFFDEATSALDNNTQAIVSKSLDQLQATRIVIAHRLSTIINCNRIIVMDQGRIVETGTYQELMNKNGIFAELAKRQLA